MTRSRCGLIAGVEFACFPRNRPIKAESCGRIVPNCSAFRKRNHVGNGHSASALPFFEIAPACSCVTDHVARIIVNANHRIVVMRL